MDDKTKRKLLSLSENWDGYGAPAVDPKALFAAEQFVSTRSVVPTVSGGIQLEWHSNGWDVEIEFNPDGTIKEIEAEKAHGMQPCSNVQNVEEG